MYTALLEMPIVVPRLGLYCKMGRRALCTGDVRTGVTRSFDPWSTRTDDLFPYEDKFAFNGEEVDSSTVLELLEPFVSAARRATIAKVEVIAA